MLSMQYLYWEKVQPPKDGPELQIPYLDMIPLMRIWTESAANARDNYDALHGRDRAKVNPLGLVRISFFLVPFNVRNM